MPWFKVGDYRRLSSHNATHVTGYAAIGVLLTWMRSRRIAFDLRQVALRGGMGVLATMAFEAMDEDLLRAQGFWDTAQFLLATYGAYEAYQLVRFNLDSMRLAGLGAFDFSDDDQTGFLRVGSRMEWQHNMFRWRNPFQQGTPMRDGRPMAISGTEELRALLAVMAAALLFQRLGLRRRINILPLQAAGLLALATELPVTRNRR